MKKIAIFVEGQTEVIFVKALIAELAGANNVVFHEEMYHAKSFIVMSATIPAGESYFVLIVNCCSDGAVLSAILDRHASLTASGYDAVIGLRDLHPLVHGDLHGLTAAIAAQLPTGGAPVSVVVAIAEVEAWFVQENHHYLEIDAALTTAKILADTGYDVDNDAAENLPHPAGKLDDIYRIAGKRYTKKRKHVSRTVSALDYPHLYLDRRAMLHSFDMFAQRLEASLGF